MASRQPLEGKGQPSPASLQSSRNKTGPNPWPIRRTSGPGPYPPVPSPGPPLEKILEARPVLSAQLPNCHFSSPSPWSHPRLTGPHTPCAFPHSRQSGSSTDQSTCSSALHPRAPILGEEIPRPPPACSHIWAFVSAAPSLHGLSPHRPVLAPPLHSGPSPSLTSSERPPQPPHLKAAPWHSPPRPLNCPFSTALVTTDITRLPWPVSQFPSPPLECSRHGQGLLHLS